MLKIKTIRLTLSHKDNDALLGMNTKLEKRIINGAILGIMGLWFSLVSWPIAWDAVGLIFTGECVEGIVQGTNTKLIKSMIRDRRGDTVLQVYPIISYTTRTGCFIDTTSKFPIYEPFSCDIGKKVQVYYQANNPTNMRILNPSTFFPAIFFLTGIGMCGLSCFSVWNTCRKILQKSS